MSEKLKGFLIFLVVGLVIAIAVIIANWRLTQPVTQRLSDGFFVAGVLLIGMGGLKYVRNQGFFDMASYGITAAFHTAFPGTRSNSPLDQREEDFLSYKERKKAERKPATEILLAGAAYLALAAIMLVIYLLTT